MNKYSEDLLQSTVEPSYLMVAFLCDTQYKRLIKIEDDIYTKVSILIAFMAALLIVVVNDMKWKEMFRGWDLSSLIAFIHTGLYQILSLASLLGMLLTTFIALKISLTKREHELDATRFNIPSLYKLPASEVAQKMIDDLCLVIDSFRKELDHKQAMYNGAVRLLTISTVLYVMKVVIENVLG